MKKNLVVIGFVFICIALATSCSKDSKYICKCQYSESIAETVGASSVNYDVHNLGGMYYKNCEEFEESATAHAMNLVNCEHVH